MKKTNSSKNALDDKRIDLVNSRVDNLSNIFDVVQRENDNAFADLQTRVHKLESSSVSEDLSNSDDRKFWRNCLGILCVSIGIIFVIELAVIVILSKIGLC